MTNETKKILVKSHFKIFDNKIEEIKEALKELSDIILTDDEKSFYGGKIKDNNPYIEVWELDNGSGENLIFSDYELGSIGKHISKEGKIKKIVVNKKDFYDLPDKK